MKTAKPQLQLSIQKKLTWSLWVWVCVCIDLFQILHNDRFNTDGCSQLYHNPKFQIVFEELIFKYKKFENFYQKNELNCLNRILYQ